MVYINHRLRPYNKRNLGVSGTGNYWRSSVAATGISSTEQGASSRTRAHLSLRPRQHRLTSPQDAGIIDIPMSATRKMLPLNYIFNSAKILSHQLSASVYLPAVYDLSVFTMSNRGRPAVYKPATSHYHISILSSTSLPDGANTPLKLSLVSCMFAVTV